MGQMTQTSRAEEGLAQMRPIGCFTDRAISKAHSTMRGKIRNGPDLSRNHSGLNVLRIQSCANTSRLIRAGTASADVRTNASAATMKAWRA